MQGNNISSSSIANTVKLIICFCSGVYVCGHSAGGQLAAILLSVDWMSECMATDSIIKGMALQGNKVKNLVKVFFFQDHNFGQTQFV